MRTSIVKIVGACFALFAATASAAGLADYEATCSEIGFKKRTPAYGECVLELDQRATAAKGKPMQQPKQSQEQAQSAQGDGTPDHQTCSQFGFVAGTSPYSDCRLKVDIARREQTQRQLAYEADQRRYQAEQRQYEQRLAAYEKEKERQKSLAMIRFGLAMAGGTSPNFSENVANAGRESLGMAPVPPTRPQMQNFSITGPSGRMTNCTVVGNNINCF